MYTTIRRIAALRVRGTALARALSVGGPLVLALIAARLLKLNDASGVAVHPESAAGPSFLLKIAMLWWQDVLVSVLVIVMLSGHFMLLERRPAPIRGALIWSLITVGYVLVGLDLAYFVVTDSSLTVDDIAFALRSPASGLTLVGKTLSVPMVLALIAPAFVLAIVLELRRRRLTLRLLPITPGRTFQLGFLLWPAIGIACAVHAAAPLTREASALGDNLLAGLPIEGVFMPLKRALFPKRVVLPSSRVPVLGAGELRLERTSRTRGLNVIIVLLESARPDAMSVYAPKLATTPFLADFARESLVADDMYAVLPRSSAARLVTLSGQYPATADVENRWAKDPQRLPLRTSLPVLLREHGYTSAYFSSATLGFSNDRAIVKAMQFDEVVVKEDLPQPVQGHLMFFGYEDKVLLPPLRQWLDARSQDPRPFLLTVVTNVGHYPYGLPPDYPRKPFPGKNRTHVRYLNCMSYMDEFMRDLVGALRERDLLEQSVVLVLGDHGEEFYEHGTYIRGHTLHDTVLRVPMLIRFPKSDARTGRIAGLRQQIDVLPTVADALGFELRGIRPPGRSMLTGPGHEALFFSGQQPESHAAMRIGDRKFLYDFAQDHVSVFDVQREPDEQTDLYDDVSSESLDQAEADLHEWQKRVRSTF